MESSQMNTIQKILLVLSLGLLLPAYAAAQSITEMQAMSPEERHAFMSSMSDDERTAWRDKRRAEFDSLSDEEKQAIRAQRAGNPYGRGAGRNREAMKQRWDSMSEEERAAAKDRRRAMSEKRREQWESMSEEERAAARQKWGGQKGHRGGQGQRNRGENNPQSSQPES